MKRDSKKEMAELMFKNLKDHLGEEVTVISWFYGNYQEETAVLEDVCDFVNVSVGCLGIPFVGYGSAISKIISKDGEVLYFNPYIEPKYNRRDMNDVIEAKRDIFGDQIADAEKDDEEKSEEEWEAKEKILNLAAKKSKPFLMKKGLKFIKPETVNDWIAFVEANCEDWYSVIAVKATISMMKKIESGMSFEEAEKLVYDKEFDLTGFLAGATAGAVSHFARFGEEYRKYWNKKHGVEDPEEKGTVNPAILILKQDSE